MSSQKETQHLDTYFTPESLNPGLRAGASSSRAEPMNGYLLFFLTSVTFNHSHSAPVS